MSNSINSARGTVLLEINPTQVQARSYFSGSTLDFGFGDELISSRSIVRALSKYVGSTQPAHLCTLAGSVARSLPQQYRLFEVMSPKGLTVATAVITAHFMKNPNMISLRNATVQIRRFFLYCTTSGNPLVQSQNSRFYSDNTLLCEFLFSLGAMLALDQGHINYDIELSIRTLMSPIFYFVQYNKFFIASEWRPTVDQPNNDVATELDEVYGFRFVDALSLDITHDLRITRLSNRDIGIAVRYVTFLTLYIGFAFNLQDDLNFTEAIIRDYSNVFLRMTSAFYSTPSYTQKGALSPEDKPAVFFTSDDIPVSTQYQSSSVKYSGNAFDLNIQQDEDFRTYINPFEVLVDQDDGVCETNRTDNIIDDIVFDIIGGIDLSSETNNPESQTGSSSEFEMLERESSPSASSSALDLDSAKVDSDQNYILRCSGACGSPEYIIDDCWHEFGGQGVYVRSGDYLSAYIKTMPQFKKIPKRPVRPQMGTGSLFPRILPDVQVNVTDETINKITDVGEKFVADGEEASKRVLEGFMGDFKSFTDDFFQKVQAIGGNMASSAINTTISVAALLLVVAIVTAVIATAFQVSIGAVVLADLVAVTGLIMTLYRASVTEKMAEGLKHFFDNVIGVFNGVAPQAISETGLKIICEGATSLLGINVFNEDRALASYSKQLMTVFSQYNRASAGLTSFVEMCLRGFEVIVNMLGGYANMRFSFLATGSSEVDKWVEDIGNFDPTQANTRNANLLFTLKNKGEILRKRHKDDEKVLGVIDMNLAHIKNIVKRFEHVGLNVNVTRVEPVCVMLSSPPGVGKSTIMPSIIHDLYKDLYKPDKMPAYGDMVYVWNEGAFQEAYHGQFATLFDDFGQLKNPDPSLNVFMDIIRATNVFAFPLPMASIEYKGNTYFNSEVIICSSNMSVINANTVPSIVAPQALARRFKWYNLIRNEVVDTASSGKRSFNNQYLFQLCDTNHMDGNNSYVTVGAPISYNQFLHDISDEIRLKRVHFEINSQAAMNTTRNFADAQAGIKVTIKGKATRDLNVLYEARSTQDFNVAFNYLNRDKPFTVSEIEELIDSLKTFSKATRPIRFNITKLLTQKLKVGRNVGCFTQQVEDITRTLAMMDPERTLELENRCLELYGCGLPFFFASAKDYLREVIYFENINCYVSPQGGDDEGSTGSFVTASGSSSSASDMPVEYDQYYDVISGILDEFADDDEVLRLLQSGQVIPMPSYRAMAKRLLVQSKEKICSIVTKLKALFDGNSLFCFLKDYAKWIAGGVAISGVFYAMYNSFSTPKTQAVLSSSGSVTHGKVSYWSRSHGKGLGFSSRGGVDSLNLHFDGGCDFFEAKFDEFVKSSNRTSHCACGEKHVYHPSLVIANPRRPQSKRLVINPDCKNGREPTPCVEFFLEGRCRYEIEGVCCPYTHYVDLDTDASVESSLVEDDLGVLIAVSNKDSWVKNYSNFGSRIESVDYKRCQMQRVGQNTAQFDAGSLVSSQVALRKNVWALIEERSDYRHILGYTLAVCGRVFLMPEHYKAQAETIRRNRRDIASGTIRMVKVSSPDVFVDISYSTFKEAIVIPNRHLALFTTEHVPESHNILDKFLTTDDIDYEQVNNLDGRLDTHLPDVILSQNTHFVYQPQRRLISGEVFTHSLSYDVACRQGFCGSLVMCGNSGSFPGKVLGMHVAGDEYGTGVSQCIFRDEVELALENFKPMDKILTQFAADVRVELKQPFNEGDILLLGSLKPDKASYMPTKTSIVKSAMSPFLPPVDYAPAALSKKDTENGVDPVEVALSKYVQPFILNKPGIWEACCHHVFSKIGYEDSRPRAHRLSNDKGLLTYKQAICGIPGRIGFESINRKSSPGYEWDIKFHMECFEKLYPRVGKKQLFGDKETFDMNTPLCRKLLSKAEETVGDILKGKRTVMLFEAFLKDELRPTQKVQQGKTRMIFSCSILYTILVKRYFGAFNIMIMDTKIRNGICVGANCYNNDWTNMAMRLNRFTNVIAGDFSGFDGGHMPIIHKCIVRCINRWYGDSEENQRIREVLWMETYNAHVVIKDKVFALTHCLPSGHPLTSIINSIYNHMLFRYCWILAHNNDVYALEKFDDNVELLTLGDDNVLSVSDDAISRFNQNTITQHMSSLGLEYTDETKTGRSQLDFRRLEDVEFCKRRFKLISELGQQRYIAPIQPVVLIRMLHFTKKTQPGMKYITLSNCRTSLLESSLHGEEFYKDHETTITRALMACNYPVVFGLNQVNGLPINYKEALSYMMSL